MEVQQQVKPIPFSFFISLLQEIASIPARTASSRLEAPESSTSLNRSPRTVVRRWIKALRRGYSPLPRGTTASVLRLLFPEDDTQRKFGLQETLLSRYLGQCLDSSPAFTRGVKHLKVRSPESTSGCLGQELLKCAIPRTESAVGLKSLQEVDALLDELASTSLFSDRSFHGENAFDTKRSKSSILYSLYDSLPPPDAVYLTQIILKDLRPLLYEPPSAMTRHALLAYNTHSKRVLTREQFMKEWDPSGCMIRIYKVRAKLDEAAMGFEAGGTLLSAHPRWGVPVEVPKSAKGRSPLHALELLDINGQIWAETKYDGERAQIHVRFCEDDEVNIAIFSKSKRDSTLDRVAVHSIIKATLAGIEKQDIILDAEMVAFSDERNSIDEFWRIRGLVARTAQGARATMNLPKGEINDLQPLDSCPSLHSSSSESLHLALVFFDVLLFGSASLLNVPYSVRRSMLESVIHEIPGRAMIAKRSVVSSGTEVCIQDAAKSLREIWAQHIVESQEGLVLKAGESTYGDWRLPWVKLKKDYIPGHGDAIDLVVIAGSWEKDRARELRVPPSTLTTFYIGSFGNSAQCIVDPAIKPHFVVYFTASYGLSREQLEEFNFWIRADAVELSSRDELSYSYSILKTLSQPMILLRTPILVELCGAGFTKGPGSKFYELRFPRITKIFRSSERSFMECLTLRELQTIAYESTGRDIRDTSKYKDLDDWVNHLWRNGEGMDQEQDQNEERRLKKHASLREEWESKFENLDIQRAKRNKRKQEDTELSP